jgi:hypothetical protein
MMVRSQEDGINACDNVSVGIDNYGLSFAFNTSGISGTVVSAVLWFQTTAKYTDGPVTTSRGFYVKKTSGSPPPASEIPGYFNTDPTTNKVGAYPMSSVGTGTQWNSVTLSSPDTTVNKSGTTYLYLFMADPIVGTLPTNGSTQRYGAMVTGAGGASAPYLVVTTVISGVRLIVVVDSE